MREYLRTKPRHAAAALLFVYAVGSVMSFLMQMNSCLSFMETAFVKCKEYVTRLDHLWNPAVEETLHDSCRVAETRSLVCPIKNWILKTIEKEGAYAEQDSLIATSKHAYLMALYGIGYRVAFPFQR